MFTNKILAIVSIVCFVLMAGFFSYLGPHIPDHWTIGKTVTIFTFAIYEILCIVTFIYFWLKK